MRSDLRRYHGVSLGQMFAGEITPDEIWDYITHLPRTSATTSAFYADPETVLSDELPEIRLTEFSPEAEMGADIHDVLIAILAHLSAFTSKKPVRLKPHRRPGEARRAQLKAERREQARQEWAELCAQMGVPT